MLGQLKNAGNMSKAKYEDMSKKRRTSDPENEDYFPTMKVGGRGVTTTHHLLSRASYSSLVVLNFLDDRISSQEKIFSSVTYLLTD